MPAGETQHGIFNPVYCEIRSSRVLAFLAFILAMYFKSHPEMYYPMKHLGSLAAEEENYPLNFL